VLVNLVYVKLWGLATTDEDKILIKNLHHRIPGLFCQKTNESISCKRLEQKWTVMQRHVYQGQIYSVDELKWELIDVWVRS